MLGLIGMTAAYVAMYRIATNDGNNGALWAGITALIAIGSKFFVSSRLAGIIALTVSFGAMFAYNIKKNSRYRLSSLTPCFDLLKGL